jgi:hypothetical protein
MKMHRTVLMSAVLTCGALAAGCSSDTAVKPGVGGTSGGGGGSTGTGMAVPLTPSPSGFVAADSNTLGAVGAWYAYGDGYEGGTPPGKCQTLGKHMTTECSKIAMPILPPGTAGFPPSATGAMCTSGTVAQVLVIPGSTPPVTDYSNMYGAGIGLDLNNPGGVNTVKGIFDATTKGVTGISFDIDTIPLGGLLRVEFATTDTDGSVAGADYWGAKPTGAFPNSPVKVGTNTLHWNEVDTPAAMAAGAPKHVFNPSLIESIQFHVPTNTTASAPYSFCISNLKLLM